MEPIVLFGIQFTLSLVAYALIAFWYVAPVQAATGGSSRTTTVGSGISHCGWDDPGSQRGRRRSAHGVPGDDWIWRHGNGRPGPAGIDRAPYPLLRAIALVWLFIVVGMLDTINAIIQSLHYSVFTYALGVNWVIVTIYVAALLVSSLLIFMQLLNPNRPSKR
jgi:hypothetical protein